MSSGAHLRKRRISRDTISAESNLAKSKLIVERRFVSRAGIFPLNFARMANPFIHWIEAKGPWAPWLFLALFLAASFLMLWRLEVLSAKGFEGTVLGTLVMPYCTGMGNLIFAFILGRNGGSGADVMTNSLVNNITNMTLVLGLLGGLVIGGWVFLSNGYALGGDSLRYSWAFDTKFWYFFPYNTEMNETTTAWLSGTAAKTGTWFTPHFWAYAYGAAGTGLVTVLRQLFAGFWFHPIGFILASTGCLSYIWGSALTAWVIRRVVLWMGGAATIRNKLQPFFVGVLLGAVVAELLLCAHGQHLRSLGIERFFGVLSPP